MARHARSNPKRVPGTKRRSVWGLLLIGARATRFVDFHAPRAVLDLLWSDVVQGSSLLGVWNLRQPPNLGN